MGWRQRPLTMRIPLHEQTGIFVSKGIVNVSLTFEEPVAVSSHIQHALLISFPYNCRLSNEPV